MSLEAGEFAIQSGSGGGHEAEPPPTNLEGLRRTLSPSLALSSSLLFRASTLFLSLSLSLTLSLSPLLYPKTIAALLRRRLDTRTRARSDPETTFSPTVDDPLLLPFSFDFFAPFSATSSSSPSPSRPSTLSSLRIQLWIGRRSNVPISEYAMVPEIPFEHVRDVSPIRISRNTEISVEKRERVCRKPDRVPDRSSIWIFVLIFDARKKKKRKNSRRMLERERIFE